MASGRAFFEVVTFSRVAGATLFHVTDSARWLRQIAMRREDPRHRDRPAYAQRFGRARRHPAEEALSAAPGVSVRTARALLGRYGSLAAVIETEAADWQLIPGVGPQRAASLASMVHDEWTTIRTTSHSDVNRNGKDPST